MGGRILVVAAQLLKSLDSNNGRLLQASERVDGVSWRRGRGGHIK